MFGRYYNVDSIDTMKSANKDGASFIVCPVSSISVVVLRESIAVVSSGQCLQLKVVSSVLNLEVNFVN